MTKTELQKEILAKVKPGTKPSDLKKLKRSKSAGDIPTALSLPQTTALTRSKSQEPFADPKYPFTTLVSQSQEIETLKKESETKSTTIALLRKKIEELEQTSLNSSLELAHSQNVPVSELDQSLFARHRNLKDWFKAYQETKKLDAELAENIDQASEELISQDQKLTQLRSENIRLKQINQSLTKDLSLAQRLAEHRKTPLPNSSPDPMNYLKYALYALSAVWIVIILLKAQKTSTLNPNQE